MVVAKLEPANITYVTLNNACEKSRRRLPQQPVALLREMAVVKLEPKIITYGTGQRMREEQALAAAAGRGAAEPDDDREAGAQHHHLQHPEQ
eukprot:4316149-Pyramimonas_sp.AAC.1